MNSSLRFRVLSRDNFTCRYCGATAPDVRLEVDHVIPQAEGGTDAVPDLVTACFQCNNGKRDYLLPLELVELIASRKPLPPPMDLSEVYEAVVPVSLGYIHTGPDEIARVWKCAECGVTNSLDGDVCSCAKTKEPV